MISFNSPLAQFNHFADEIQTAIRRVLLSGQYILGREVEALEIEFASYIGSAFAIGVANGTDAIALALRALDVGPGDEVITVSMTAVATVAAIEMVGAKPVFVDVDPVHYTMDPKSLSDAISAQTRAVIPVHLYGQPAEMPEILRVCGTMGIPIVEDCSQAHGATIDNKRVGSLGTIGAFSCYPTKNLGALGDAGLLTTNDTAIASRLKALRQYGWQKRNWSQEPGVNSRLDELQAAILRTKLVHLDQLNARRAQIANTYSEGLLTLPLNSPQVRPNSTHAWHLYTISVDSRDIFQEKLKALGVTTGIYYPFPIHLQPAYSGRRSVSNSLRVTEELSKRVLSLPLFPEMTDGDVSTVLECVHRCFQR